MNDDYIRESVPNVIEACKRLAEEIRQIWQAFLDSLKQKKPLPRPQKKIMPRYAAPIIRPQHRARSAI